VNSATGGANGSAESFVNVDEMEVDRVEGRDLLKYVRELLR